MVDLKHVLENPELYTREMEKRFYTDPTLANQLTRLHADWKQALHQFEEQRRQQKAFNETVVGLTGEDKQAAIGQMKQVSLQVKALEEQVRELRRQMEEILYQIPNLTWAGIPVGKDDSFNLVTKVYQDQPDFSFEPKNYYELPVFIRDYLGETGVKAAGSRGYYIKGELARFQRVLFNWVLDRLIQQGFEYVIPPIMVNEQVMYGTGFFPTGKNDFYTVNPQEDNLFLVGSSEPSLMFMDSDSVLELDTPRKLTAWTSCFRREAGTYGKDTKGGIRVHQFEKVETVYICKPQDSLEIFDQMTDIFRQTLQLLQLHFQDLEVCSGDISIKNHRQIDIEAWFPAQKAFREVCSSSNCGDYQTRNLDIKYRKDDGSTELAHSLNCTGVTNRTMFAIMEQFQTQDGRVKVPDVLIPYFGKEYLE